MAENNKNEQKLKRLFSLMDEDSLTKEDFLEAFQNVVKLVKKMQEKNIQEIEQFKQTFESAQSKLKGDNNVDLSDVKKQIAKQLKKALDDQAVSMNLVKDKVRKLKDGKDGVNPETQDVVDKVLEQIQLPEQKEILLDSPEQFRDKVVPIIEELIKDMQKDIKGLKFRPMPTGSGGVGGGHVKVFDLSDSLDGSTKTFSLPAYWRIISVTSSSFPTAFRPITDYTTDEANSKITFTSEVDASTMLASGQSIIIVYATA